MLMQLPSEQAAVVATVDPDNYAVGAQTSDWVNMADFRRVMGVVMLGALSSGQTLDAKIQQATNSSGGSAKDISGKSITQLTLADADKQAVINVDVTELDMDNDFTHVALVITGADSNSPTGNIDFGGLVLGFDERHGPASDNDLASVDEIVS